MRIAMVGACPYPTTQGSQVYIRGQAEALAARGHEVHIVCYHFGEAQRPSTVAGLHRTIRVPGYTKLRAGPSWGKPLLDLLLAQRLLQVVRDHDIEVIHAHNYEAPIAGFLVRRATGVPVVYNSHNTMSEELHLYFDGAASQWIARKVGRWLDGAVPRRADATVAISEEAMPVLAGLGVPTNRLFYVPPGVCLEDFQGDSSHPLAARLPEAPRVVYAGNPDRYQGLDVLLDAFVVVYRELPAARLLLVSGADLDELKAAAAKRGIGEAVECVQTASWVAVRALMQRAQVAALTRPACSGFPIKLLNYMAAGLPTVCSEGSAKPLEDGRTGTVVPNQDPASTAEALLALLRDPETAEAMGMAARTAVHSTYSWARRAQELEAVYDRALVRPC